MSRYLVYLSMGDIQSAYEALTVNSQKKCSLANFKKGISDTIYDIKGIQANDKNDTTSEVEARVVARARGGPSSEPMTCRFLVIKEGGKWKIELYKDRDKDAAVEKDAAAEKDKGTVKE